METQISADLLVETMSTEQVSPVEVLAEKSANGTKQLSMRAPLIVMDRVNANGRVYSSNLMVPIIEDYISSSINVNRGIGELMHPDVSRTSIIDLYRVSHKITRMWREGNVYMGTVSPLRGTNAGDIFASLLEHGVVIGTSSRGVGQVDKDGSVVKYKIVTASDIEYNPSAPDAFFTALTERDNTLDSVLTALDKAGYLAKMQKFDSNKALQFAATLLKTELSNKFQF